MLDDCIVVQFAALGGRFSWVFRSSGLFESPWTIKSDIGTDFLFDGGMSPLKHSLLCLQGISLGLSGRSWKDVIIYPSL